MQRRTRSRALIVRVVCLAQLATACGVARNPPAKSTPKTERTSKAPPSTSSLRSRTLPATGSLGTTGASSSGSPAGVPFPGCHPTRDPRAGVNTPLRLIVRSRCIRVRGIAGCIFTDRDDGDTHIALLLASAKAAGKYLTPGNRSWTCDSDQGSDTAPRLVIEVIPQHCTVRPDNCADLGHFTDPQIPLNGQHVTITGPWVQDTSKKQGRTLWSEIHPAWRITVDADDVGQPVTGTHNFEQEDEGDG